MLAVICETLSAVYIERPLHPFYVRYSRKSRLRLVVHTQDCMIAKVLAETEEGALFIARHYNYLLGTDFEIEKRPVRREIHAWPRSLVEFE